MPVVRGLVNHVANPPMRALLRSPAGRRLGRHLAVIRYTGVRTGLRRELVAGYARSGTAAWIFVGGAASKRWWRNFRTPAPVELWLAGEHVTGRGVAVDGATDPETCREGVAAYVASVPGGGRAMRLEEPPDRLTSDDVRGIVMVRVDVLRQGVGSV
jgi:hypothetical protein